MSRSTVQDKLKGKNAPRLWQILALVQACSDYAKSIGAPLPHEETDEQAWSERTRVALVESPFPNETVAASLPPVPREEVASSTHAPGSESTDPSERFDLIPLTRAGMADMIELIQGTQGQPMAEWLPELCGVLRQAQMSDEQFLVVASMEQPHAVARSILALHFYEEPKARDRLIYLSTCNQSPESIPILLVLLRRNGEGDGDELAEKLLSVIPTRDSPAVAASRCVNVVRALREATMEMDVKRLLERTGERGDSNLILRVAASFPDTTYGDREQILSSVAKGSEFHIFDVLRTLRGRVPDGIDPAKTLDRIIFGIPWGKNAQIAADLRERGLTKEAERVMELEDEPPF